MVKIKNQYLQCFVFCIPYKTIKWVGSSLPFKLRQKVQGSKNKCAVWLRILFKILNLKSSIKGGIYSVKTRSSWQPSLCAVWPRGNQLGCMSRRESQLKVAGKGDRKQNTLFQGEGEQNLQRPLERAGW